jgi:hypothetical protein
MDPFRHLRRCLVKRELASGHIRQRAFTAPKLFEHRDDKNNQAGHLFFMIIGARPTYAPCQAGFHELRIGWSQS